MKDEELLYKVSEIAEGMHFDARFLVLTLVERYKVAKAEIEMLKTINNALTMTVSYKEKEAEGLKGEIVDANKIKAEAIKEFEDKFKKGADFSVKYIYHYPPVGLFNCNNRTPTKYYTITAEKLENIIKEMMGE